MKEQDTQKKIRELEKQLKKKKEKKVIVKENDLDMLLSILMLIIWIFIFKLISITPPSTILGIIGSFAIILALIFVSVPIIKSLFLIKKKK